MEKIKNLARSALGKTGYDVIRLNFKQEADIAYSEVRPYATYSPWLNDKNFMTLYEKVRSNTLVDIYRCYELCELVSQVSNVPGDILEVGVWRGGTGALIASKANQTNPDKKVILCDTFKGVVKASIQDSGYKGGEHADTSVGIVEDLLQSLSLSNYFLLRGIFPEDTGHHVENNNFSLVHVDVDTYESARDIVDFTWPRLSKNGVIVFDDYGFYTCAGVTRLVNEYKNHSDKMVFHNLNGHAVIFKI